MSPFMVPRTLFMAANILCSLPFTYWFLLSFTRRVLFLTQRINTTPLLSLFPAPRCNIVKLSSPWRVILSHLSRTGLHDALPLLQHNQQPGCNALHSVTVSCLTHGGWTPQGRQSRNSEIRRGLERKPDLISLNVPAERDVQELFICAGSAGLLTLDAGPYWH